MIFLLPDPAYWRDNRLAWSAQVDLNKRWKSGWASEVSNSPELSNTEWLLFFEFRRLRVVWLYLKHLINMELWTHLLRRQISQEPGLSFHLPTSIALHLFDPNSPCNLFWRHRIELFQYVEDAVEPDTTKVVGLDL